MKKFIILFLYACFAIFQNLIASDYYWVNGTGNWSDAASHWATTSGGSVFHLTAPTLSDDVHFDANSFPLPLGQVTVDVMAQCRTMDWTGVTNSPTLTGNNSIEFNGSLIFVPGMTFGFNGSFRFTSPNAGNTVNFAGLTTPNLNNIEFNGEGGWTLLSDIDIEAAMGMITFSGGTLNTNGYDIKCNSFNSWFITIPRILNFSSSEITCNNFWLNPGADLSFNSGTSKINLKQNWFNGGDLTYYDIQFNLNFSGDIMVMGSNNFHIIDFSSDSVKSITFESGKTTLLFDFLTGSRCNMIKSISSNVDGQITTIKKISGTLTKDYLAVKDIKVIGGATFITNNGINLGNVTNWTINPPSGTALYWVGGTGNWNDPSHWSATSGGTYPSSNTCPPTVNDNVFFDNNSFTAAGQTVTLTGNAFCKTMDWSLATNNPTFNASWYSIVLNGSFILSPNMTINTTGEIMFISNIPGWTINTGNHNLNSSIVFEGSGSWTLAGDINTTNWLMHNNGTIIINDKIITAYSYNSSTQKSRNLTFTTGSFICSSWYLSDNTNYTFIPGTTSSIIINGSSFTSENISYKNLVLNSSSYTYLYGNNSFASISNTNTGDIFLEAGKTITTSDLSSDGNCGKLVKIASTQNGTVSNLVLNSPETISYSAIMDLNVTGAILTANNSVDQGNNTGITFNALSSVNYYWIGGGGNWSDPLNWSLSSGGPANPGGCIPTISDNVFFDASSGLGGQTVTIDAEAYCNNFTFSANNATLAGSSALNVYGNYALVNTLTYNYTGNVNFLSNTAGKTINTAGRTIRSHFNFNGNGSWTLQGALTLSTTYSKNIYLEKGSLITNNFNITCNYFYSYSGLTRQLTLGSSVITCNYWYIPDGTNMTITPGTSTINEGNSSFYGGGLIYNNVNMSTTSGATIYGSNTFNIISAASCTRLNIEMGTTQTVTTINFPNGTGCTSYFDITSTQPGSPATISKSGAVLNKSWIRITDVIATGTATFNATNSIGVGNYTGWNITSAGTVDYYWVGNGGNWTDPAHWSLSSGGVPNPSSCIPDIDDNVYFDALSFTIPDQTVTMNNNGYCRNMDWTGVTQNPEYAGYSSLYLSGSLTLNNNIDYSYSGTIYFVNTAGVTIMSYGKTISGIYLSGSGLVTMNDNLNIGWGGITFNSGSFSTNNFDILAYSGGFTSNSTSTRTLSLGSSDLYFSNWDIYDATGMTLNAGTSNIRLGNNCWQFNGGDLTYYNVLIEKYQWGYFYLGGSNSFNTLFFEPGCEIMFEKSSTQHTTNLFAIGQQTAPIRFESSEENTAYNIIQTGTFCGDWLEIKDCHASTATFYAGVHSVNLGGNTGWTWSGVTANDQYPAALCENVAGSGIASGINLTLLNSSIAGGQPGHTHLWFYDAALSSPVFTPSNVSATNGQIYYDLVSNGTCNNVALVTYTVNPKPIITLLATNPLCHGGNTGSIDATVSNGTPLYTYQWSNSALTEDITNLTIGTYTLTVTDVNNCKNTATTTLSEPAILTVTESHVNITCNSLCNGSVNVTTTGGVSPYSYLWDGPSGYNSSNEDISGLCAGTYNATITDDNSCTAILTVEITQPDLLAATTTPVNITCSGACNGAIGLSVTGGTSPYLYSWTGPSGYTSANEDINGLCAGTYNLTVTDSHSCTTTSAVTITEPSALSHSETVTNLLCNGICSGVINVTPSGGTSPYSMLWSSGHSGTLYSNLCAGAYTGTLTDNNLCTSVVNVTITEPASVIVTVTQTPITCPGICSGGIDLTVSGGIPPFDFIWSGPSGFTSTSEDLSGLCAGNYNLTVTDDNGCIYINSMLLPEPAAWNVSSTVTNNLCNGNCSGSIGITVSGATQPYLFSWQGPSFSSANEDINSLCAGTYDLTITDNASCIYTQSYNVTEPSLLTIDSQSSTNISCHNSNDGTVNISASGGTGTIQYNIGTGNQPAGVYTGLSAGSYTVTVSDANSCTTVSNTYHITNPASLSIVSETSSDITCFGNANGNITVVAAGGTIPLAYDLGSGQQPNGVFSNLTPGTYTVTIVDSHGCTITTVPVTLSEPVQLTIDSENNTDLTCYNSNDGTVTITASGGTGLLTYDISSSNNTTGLFTGLSAGNYQVTVSDINNCSASSAIMNITEPAQIVLSETHTDVTTCGASDGTIDLTITGGILPLGISWTGPMTFTSSSEDLTALEGGIYNVTVTDNNSCSGTLIVAVNETGAPVLSSTSVNNICFGECNGSITTTATGGTSPYNFFWSNGQTTQNLSLLCAGEYILTVTDNAGCNTYLIEEITEPDSVHISIIVSNESCHSTCDGEITVNVTGGTAPFSYDFGSGASASNTISGLCPGLHYVTVTDNPGCINSDSAEVLPYTIGLSFTNTGVLCFGECNGVSAVAITGSTGPYTYLWSNNEVTSIIANLCEGIYDLTVTDNSGCETTGSDTITEPAAITSMTITTDDHGTADGTATVTVTGGVPPYSYNWSSGGTSDTETDLAAGTYFVTISDINGCSVTDTAEVLLNVGFGFSEGNTLINVFPNPFSENITIVIANAGSEVNISIADISGRIIFESISENNGTFSKTITLPEQAEGMYFVRISGENFNYSGKLIKR